MSSFDIPSISFSGLATGLDTSSIIASLVAVKRMPIYLLENQKSDYQSKIDYYERFKDKLDDLENAAEDLKDPSDFNLFKTTMNTEGYLTASASSTAMPGTYNIQITDLATFEQEASGNFSDKTSSLGSGTITLNVGGTETEVTIEDGDDTLNGIVAAINDSDAEVTASIINDGSDTPYRLVITGNDTGEDNTISISTTGLSGLGSFTELQGASDAHFEINNISMQSDSNTVTGAVQGLNLKLTGATEADSPVIVTVDRDSEEIKSEITDFINAYNDVMSFINTQSTYNDSSESGGVLMGESMLQRMQISLSSIFIPSDYDADPGAPDIQILADIGITLDSDSTFSIDGSELLESIDENFDDVVRLFTSTDEGDSGNELGFAVRMDTFLNDYTKLEGIIDTKTGGYEEIIRNLETQINGAEGRLEDYESGLVKKYAALEQLMSGLNSQQSILYSFGSSN